MVHERAALFLAFLSQHDDAAWLRAVDRLEPRIHPVDRTATRIWFHFYPLTLQQAIDAAPDPEAAARRAVLDGRWRLADQIDTSHTFLHGHRHWPAVKRAVLAYATRDAAPGSLDLAAQVQEVARVAAAEARAEVSLVVGITAIGLRTLQQVGLDRLAASPADPPVTPRAGSRDPEAVLAARARDDGQGLLGFLKGDRKRWTVTFDEGDPEARFPLTHSQHLTTAAAEDRRDHRQRDPRCAEGPIPVQCRSCSCGTCWVGVLGGAGKLSAVDDRERAKLAECGYGDAAEPRPLIRLACMAQAYGAVSIVIPPWNGKIARLLK